MFVTAIGVGDRASHKLTALPMIFGEDGVVLLRLSRQLCTELLHISTPFRHKGSAEVTMGMYVAGGVFFVIVAWAALTYNKLIKMRNMVKEGWSGIDVQLKRRATLIPVLVETVKGYMGHERGLLSEIADLRSKSLRTEKIGEKGAVETALSRTVGNLMAVAEGYPDLKASHNFGELQKELTEIEDQIQMARRYYNGTVRNLNIAVETFPSTIVAKLFTFTQAEFFAINDEAERNAPQITLGGQG